MLRVYYPYWEGGARWEELRYSLRSLERHLKADYEVVIVGDKPAWLTNVTHIPYERNNSEVGSALKNTLRMMLLLLDWLEATGEDDAWFLRMYDDVYFLKDRSEEDLRVTRLVRDAGEALQIASGGMVWRRQVTETIVALRERGYEGYLTESHCPELFAADKMRFVYSAFGLPERELLTSTLYYNLFPHERMMMDKKVERALFYGSETAYSFGPGMVERKCADKVFLNHNDQGLDGEVKGFLERRFGERSRFEK